MGGHPWFYDVEYEPDINAALQKLREREFRAGRYNPAMMFPEFPVSETTPGPGAQHSSIAEAMVEADADGTRSILDMERVSNRPEYCAVCALSKEQLFDLFGTDKPTRTMVEDSYDLFEFLERGKGVYIILYDDGERPAGIFFAGYSFD